MQQENRRVRCDRIDLFEGGSAPLCKLVFIPATHYPDPLRCGCESFKRGMTVRPCRSIRWVAEPARAITSRSLPVARVRPFATASAVTNDRLLSCVAILPLRKMASGIAAPVD